jgi:hypothetical protein
MLHSLEGPSIFDVEWIMLVFLYSVTKNMGIKQMNTLTLYILSHFYYYNFEVEYFIEVQICY